MKYETAGDPMTALKWTRKTTEKISEELSKVGIAVSKTTVGKLLKKMNFSLKTNAKKISNGGKSKSEQEQKERDQQFQYITHHQEQCLRKCIPVISVDTKKKELIGNFKNPGTRYRKEADLTNDHDFQSYAEGKAIPFSIFDGKLNQGYVYVGQQLWKDNSFTSADTPEFAVESIEKWWATYGINQYPGAKELLIVADAGGSNGYRPHMWKFKLQKLLCDKHELTVTVCHYPPGASKWNPIEHRLFSEISKNWRGVPLKNFETVLNYIDSTKTKTGLNVRSELVTKQYKKGIKISKIDIKELRIQPHDIMPKLNYTLFSTN
jgi:hypothetical protein